MKRSHAALAALAFFLAGIALRLPGLGNFLTADEHLWAERTGQFLVGVLRHDWASTQTSGHPGVITTWAGSLGLALKWLVDRPAGVGSLADLAQGLNQGPLQRDLLPFLRLPVVVLCAAGVACVYLLARRLLPEAIALLGALFLLFDPFFLAHSRVLHLDALATTSITVAWLALLVATRTRQRGYYVLAGLALGLGVLTKSPALVLGPLVVVWVCYANWRTVGNLRKALLPCVYDLLWLGLPAGATVFMLWPALWIDPLHSAVRVMNLMLTYAETGHELGSYWLGSQVDDPGPLFYGAVILWRTMPVVLLGLALAAGFTIRHLVTRKSSPASQAEDDRRTGAAALAAAQRWLVSEMSVVGALWVLVLWYAVILALGAKKFDRYLLPIFPALDLLAAWGWVCAAQRVQAWMAVRRQVSQDGGWAMFEARVQGRRFVPAVLLLLFIGQAAATLRYLPDYLDAFNPLLGGMVSARQVMLVGWGEGLEATADFLNGQDATGIKSVASWYGSSVFLPFYRGQSYDLLEAKPADLYSRDVDYVVTYVNQMQRNLLDPEIAGMLQAPLFTETRDGVALAQVYRWPKPFDHTADRPMAPGLRLVGWDDMRYEPDKREVEAALHWDARALQNSGAPPPPISAWLKDENGEVWATVEAQTVSTGAGIGPSWDGRQAITQRFTLEAPAGLRAGAYRVEVGTGDRTQGLGSVQIAATRLDQVVADSAETGWRTANGNPTWPNGLRLAGYTLERQDGGIVLDLMWAPGEPPSDDLQIFVHLTGPDGQMVTQVDGPLVETGAKGGLTWQPGDLVRHRVRLTLPENASRGPYSLYTGLYKPGGARLPVTVNGAAVGDGRYLINAF